MNALPRFAVALALCGALAACGKTGASAAKTHAHEDEPAEKTSPDRHGHEHDEPGHGDDASARFDAEHGLQLAPETVTAIGLTAVAAEPRHFAPRVEITATVFDAGPPARASALVPLDLADAFGRDPRVLATHRDTQTALGQVELVVAASLAAIGSTLTIELRGAARDTLAVPGSAVLRTATGAFVYVQRGGYWSRTAVTTGASDGDSVGITTGLAAGDVVAATAVEHLWLTELRLTKGGGHSH